MDLQSGEATRHLADHLHAAAFGGDIVLLDLRSGDYELLAGLADKVRLSPSRRVFAFQDESLLAELDDLGLFGPSGSEVSQRDHAKPAHSAGMGLKRTVSHQDRLWMVGGWLQMLRFYYRRPFGDLLKVARSHPLKSSPTAATQADLLERAEVFNHLSIWTPFAGDCFYRCFMLLRLLGDDAQEVDWVFGVRTWPFLAHCWVQHGSLVLTDNAETVALFSPILVA